MPDAANLSLGPGGEFDAIKAALARWGPLASGVGDDCAVLDVPAGERLVMSLDTSLEDVHFRRRWLTPEEIGYRATMSALSDLAAMAAAPLGIAAAFSLPDSWRGDWVRLCDGIGDAVRLAGTRILGGDLNRGTVLSLSVTVLGHAAAPMSRRGARVGDALWVTGRLGGPFLAIDAWERGFTPRPEFRERFAHPVARLEEGRWLAAHGATAGIDVSDGVVADAAHLAAAGRVRIVLDLDRLPVLPGASPDDAARSGEEYELVVSAPATLDVDTFERTFAIPLTRIGTVEAMAPDLAQLETRRAGLAVEPPRGHDHLAAP